MMNFEFGSVVKELIRLRRSYCRMRSCLTCQNLKRPEIDRRLAAGEPAARIARDYELNPSSLYRHRVNCLKLGSSNAIMKETARGTAAVALLPSKETLSGAYFELRTRIDQIVAQAQAEGSLFGCHLGLKFAAANPRQPFATGRA